MTKDHIRQMIAQLQKMMLDAPETEAAIAKDNPTNSQCSFCGELRADTGPMVEGPNGVYMCCNCVELALPIAQNIRRKKLSELEARIVELESGEAKR